MKVKNKILPVVLITISILLVGCSKSEIKETTLENTIIQKHNENEYKIQTSEFDVGSETYISTSKKEMPYKIRGIISIPEGAGKFPIVLIAHGSHENIKEGKRFDIGFKYLTEELAKNGYIAVSMDLANAYLWKYGDSDDKDKVVAMIDKHIENLKKANGNDIEEYNINLKDKIDFEKLSLIGHSRGGEFIFSVASEQLKKGQKINALLPIAPTAMLLDTPYFDTDIPTSIIIPEYDGDVVDLAGFNIYDILTSKKRSSFTQVTMLKKANHNYFNKNVLPNDSTMTRIDLSDQLTREQQEDFLSSYTVDFLNAVVKNNIENSIYDTKIATPSNMYGYDVKTLYKDENSKELVDIEKIENFKGEKIEIESTQDSWFYKSDEMEGIESITLGNGEFKIRKLLNIKWNELNSNVKFKPSTSKFNEYDSIVLNVLQDSSDKLNKKGENQQFTIELKDKKGNISRVELDKNTRALDYIDGELMDIEIEGKKYYSWSCNTPITQIRVPLNIFEGIDLNNISDVCLLFNKTESGSIVISSIDLN